jgi:hypothetical protein
LGAISVTGIEKYGLQHDRDALMTPN